MGPSSSEFRLDDDGVVRPITAPVTPVDGGLYTFICVDADTDQEVVNRPMTTYDPADPVAGLGGDGDLAAALSQALTEVRARGPVVRMSPRVDRPQMVGVETWFWIDDLDDEVASAMADGYTIRVTARPTALVVDPGDGSEPVTCAGDAALVVWGESRSSTPCGHTYFRRTSDRPGGRYRVRATLHYDVGWTATDPSGAPFDGAELPPISGTTEIDLDVLDTQAVIR